MVPGTRDFLQGVNQATHEAGALFVLDEVLTFRLAVGGRQQSVAVEPDLTLFGKLIGGGIPVGAIGGCRLRLARVLHRNAVASNPRSGDKCRLAAPVCGFVDRRHLWRLASQIACRLRLVP